MPCLGQPMMREKRYVRVANNSATIERIKALNDETTCDSHVISVVVCDFAWLNVFLSLVTIIKVKIKTSSIFNARYLLQNDDTYHSRQLVHGAFRVSFIVIIELLVAYTLRK